MKRVTSEQPKTDRIACPWLIRKFIDSEAEIDAEREGATLFDAPGAKVHPRPGRTRWTVCDPTAEAFLVNIANPAAIVMIDAADADRIDRTIELGAAGPHGLDVDASKRLFGACDAGRLLVLEPSSYRVVADPPLSGAPDVIFVDPVLDRLYVAIGDPGLIKVFDVRGRARTDAIATEPGAHTIALDVDQHRVYVFVPGSHRAAVFVDTP